MTGIGLGRRPYLNLPNMEEASISLVTTTRLTKFADTHMKRLQSTMRRFSEMAMDSYVHCFVASSYPQLSHLFGLKK